MKNVLNAVIAIVGSISLTAGLLAYTGNLATIINAVIR